jgi:hypothetical protein
MKMEELYTNGKGQVDNTIEDSDNKWYSPGLKRK